MSKYIYHGRSGNSPAITGPVFDGREIDEKDVQAGALNGLVGAGVLSLVIKAKPKSAGDEL